MPGNRKSKKSVANTAKSSVNRGCTNGRRNDSANLNEQNISANVSEPNVLVAERNIDVEVHNTSRRNRIGVTRARIIENNFSGRSRYRIC